MALLQATYEADMAKADASTLPPGWRLENGYLTLEDTRDEWIFKDDKLIRRHYLPRNHYFDPAEQDAGCPLPLHYLSKDRHTLGSDSLNQYDRWKQKKNTYRQQAWTGSTIFKIMPAYRHLARQIFYNVSNGHQSYKETETAEQAYNAQQPPRPKNMKARKDQLSERNMSLEDRLAFLTAKRKELESFFQNDVWELVYDDGSIPPDRILKAHFILKWSKWPNGDPRAKARLITQGFRDPDAWSGQLSTDAPTLSRMGRNYIMSLAANTGWSTFSADVSTAFLQGKEHPSHRTLWIKLPTDAKKMLGITDQDGDKALMKLRKPMYGLCDAPRAWYSEARERVTRLGAVVHPLDPCLFMVYDYDAPEDQWLDQPDDNGNTVRQPPLLGLFGLHVDDILGCGNMDNASFQKFIKQMKQTFTFRTWEQDSDIEYCGAKIQRINQHHYELQHTSYLAKQKPISFEDTNNNANSDQPVTEKQRTMLRGLVGALQWPATQSSPHLQASVSQLAGLTSKATTSTLREANKCLRFAKQHSDVGLKFQRIGRPEELTLIAYSDAAFASRHDLTSQGGQLILLVHHSVTTGQEGSYHIVDWRSWKLPRVARSSLAAESQAASEASDALLYAAVFWKLIWSPHLALEDSHTPKLAHSPRLIVDAKALYDLLTKQDLQTASQTDKQTSIEVLVTRDKLACTGATTSWVSSELQYADGMTKNTAASLLAQRLRTHVTCLRPDPNFTASKKKTLQQRKQSQMRYAIPKKATQMAMMASMTTTTVALNTDNNNAIHTDNMNDNNFMFLIILFTLAIALVANLIWHLLTTTWTRSRSLPPPTAPPSKNNTTDNYAQTNEDRPLLTLMQLRRREKVLEEENERLRNQVIRVNNLYKTCRGQAEKKLRDQRLTYEENVMRIRKMYLGEIKQRAKNMFMEALERRHVQN